MDACSCCSSCAPGSCRQGTHCYCLSTWVRDRTSKVALVLVLHLAQAVDACSCCSSCAPGSCTQGFLSSPPVNMGTDSTPEVSLVLRLHLVRKRGLRHGGLQLLLVLCTRLLHKLVPSLEALPSCPSCCIVRYGEGSSDAPEVMPEAGPWIEPRKLDSVTQRLHQAAAVRQSKSPHEDGWSPKRVLLDNLKEPPFTFDICCSR